MDSTSHALCSIATAFALAFLADFAAALNADATAKATYERLSKSLKGYHVTQVTSAKTDETRQRRIEKSIATLHAGKPR